MSSLSRRSVLLAHLIGLSQSGGKTCVNTQINTSQDHYLQLQFTRSFSLSVIVVCHYTGRFARGYAKPSSPASLPKVYVSLPSAPWRASWDATGQPS